MFAGASLQCIVAWAGFIHTEYPNSIGLVTDFTKNSAESHTGFHPPSDWTPRHMQRWWSWAKTRETISEMEWMGSRPGLLANGGRQAHYSGFSAGWPMRSLCGTDVVSQSVVSCAPPEMVNAPSWLVRGAWRLPIAPMWTGFLVNSALYALPMFGAVVAFRYSRIAKRRRQHRCTSCGYSVRGLGRCPECGMVNDSTTP